MLAQVSARYLLGNTLSQQSRCLFNYFVVIIISDYPVRFSPG